MTLTLGILTWRTPKTLKNTLKSYELSGLLNFADEVIIFINEAHKNDIEIAKKYNLKILKNKKNIGIGSAIQNLVENTSSDCFMFLENDWLCVENKEKVINRLKIGIELIQNGEADCIRYRHKYKFGQPLYSMLAYQGNEMKGPEGPDHLLDSVHWIEDPSLKFPDIIRKKIIDKENWFFAKSNYANYTNNPCLYKTEFIYQLINKQILSSGIALEGDIHNWWKEQMFNIAQGIGIFEHHPLQISGTGYDKKYKFFEFIKKYRLIPIRKIRINLI